MLLIYWLCGGALVLDEVVGGRGLRTLLADARHGLRVAWQRRRERIAADAELHEMTAALAVDRRAGRPVDRLVDRVCDARDRVARCAP